MYTELTDRLSEASLTKWQALLRLSGLEAEQPPHRVVLVWDDNRLIATGSREDNLLKYIAVHPDRQGEDLTSTVLSALRQDAFQNGHSHLFLYTKPQNERMFTSLFFYPIAKTDKVLLMENKQGGITDFLATLPVSNEGEKIGSIVMNGNPFTKGHQYLVETAAKECDFVYLFILSEDKSEFSAKDRLEMAKLGTKHLKNVAVLPTGPYLISSATFPTYFLKDREKATQVQCLLDIKIFAEYFIPKFSITHRYVGTEPFSPMTKAYNQTLKEHLPIVLREIPRLEKSGVAISASAVRKTKDNDTLRALLPESTLSYLIFRRRIKL